MAALRAHAPCPLYLRTGGMQPSHTCGHNDDKQTYKNRDCRSIYVPLSRIVCWLAALASNKRVNWGRLSRIGRYSAAGFSSTLLGPPVTEATLYIKANEKTTSCPNKSITWLQQEMVSWRLKRRKKRKTSRFMLLTWNQFPVPRTNTKYLGGIEHKTVILLLYAQGLDPSFIVSHPLQAK